MLSQEQILKIKELSDSGISKADIASNMNISMGSVYKYGNFNDVNKFHSDFTNRENEEEGDFSKLLQPYSEIISEQIKRKVYNSSKIYQKLTEVGFKGSYSLVNSYIRKKDLERNPNKVRIYQKVETAPGEQAQIDWGTFGKIKINGQTLNLYIFVYVLSYSRMMYAEFTVSQRQRTFQECHMHAFDKLGIPKKLRYDNVKTVVISRKRTEGGEEVYYNFDFENFAHYYNFKIEVCRPYYPQSKGKVEAGVKYLRNNFMNGEVFRKTFNSLEELNEKLSKWLNSQANNRLHSTTRERPMDLWNKEKKYLFIPDEFPKYQYDFISSRSASQNSMVTYKRSSYWVPQEYARKKINIKEINTNGVIKLEFIFKGKKIIEHPFASKIGSWILPKDDKLLFGSNKKSKFNSYLKQSPKDIEVKVRDLEYYNQFI